MASYSNYRQESSKYTRKINLFKVNRNRAKQKSYNEAMDEQARIWMAYHRANPHRFAKEYLNIDLKLFQAILLWAMMHHTVFMMLASRGLGKTFLSAVFLVIRCILFPGSKIIIAAGVKGQAAEVIAKIHDELYSESPLLQREIADIHSKGQDPEVLFHNGSWIKIVAATQNARSKRANIVMVDEFRMVDKEVIDTVLKKFLTSPRNPKFRRLPEYKNYPKEPNKQMYLSSAWYKSHWSYARMRSYLKKMAKGSSYFVAHLSYHLGFYEDMYDEETLREEMTEDDFDEIKWAMEMEAQWFGESERAYFRFEDMEVNRKEPQAFYSQDVCDMLDIKNPPKKAGEIRLIAIDVALMSGKKNDASVFSILRLIPNGNKYEKQLVAMESMEGAHSETQAIKIRQMMVDCEVDYVVIDVKGNSMALLDNLMVPLYDNERGEKYDPLNIINDTKYSDRSNYPNAEKIMYVVNATEDLNMEIASNMANSLKNNTFKMLIKEHHALERFRRQKKLKYDTLEPRVQAMLLKPYRQTEILVHEMLNLEMHTKDNGKFKLTEQGSMRKDRYSSVSYGNFIANQLARERLNFERLETSDVSDYAIFRKPKGY